MNKAQKKNFLVRSVWLVKSSYQATGKAPPTRPSTTSCERSPRQLSDWSARRSNGTVLISSLLLCGFFIAKVVSVFFSFVEFPHCALPSPASVVVCIADSSIMVDHRTNNHDHQPTNVSNYGTPSPSTWKLVLLFDRYHETECCHGRDQRTSHVTHWTNRSREGQCRRPLTKHNGPCCDQRVARS